MKHVLKIFILCTALPVCLLSAENLTQYVNPMIGTDGYGNVYPGAQIPFGGYKSVQTRMPSSTMRQQDISITILLYWVLV